MPDPDPYDVAGPSPVPVQPLELADGAADTPDSADTPPAAVPAAPAVALQYATLGASLIPPTPETLPLVQDAADHYCGRRFMRKQAVGGVVTAGVFAAIGVWLFREGRPGALPTLAFAAVCMLEGAASYVWPVPRMMFVSGLTALALAGWVLRPIFAGRISTGGGMVFTSIIALFVAFTSVTWFAAFARYRRAEGLVPAPEVAAWLEALIERIRKAKPARDDRVIDLTSRLLLPLPFVACRVELLPDMAACLMDTHHLRLLTKDEFEIERSGASRAAEVPVRVRLGRAARPVRATMKAEHLVRYQLWKDE